MRVIRVTHRDYTFYAALIDQGHVRCLNRNLGLNDPIPLEEVAILPVVWPTKIVCAAVNYILHGQELGHEIPKEPRLFLKPPSAVIGNGQSIVLPEASQQVDYEGELAMVVGQSAKNVSPEDAAQYVFGYACANDVTARDLQEKDGLFARAKGFDTFAPIGPWIETEVPDPGNLPVRTYVNDEIKQNGTTADMIFNPFELLSFISRHMTLLPGDVILTGTPAGVGPLQPGDEVKVEIETVGLLINPVTAESSESAPAAEPIQ